ncbi:MAG: glutamate ligase domain-containing protein, partial [Bacteroidota bacterium]
NMVAAMAMALMQGVTPLQLQKAVAEFRGIKRRFEIVLQNKNSVYIDDYAHHPEEIKRTLESIRALFPGKKITGIFQPHLYSRTRDLADEFAKSLDKLDQCILLPVYPAREEAIPGVNSEMIANKMSVRQVKLMEKDELIPYLRKEKPEILLSLGAGDIDRLVNDIKNSLDE